MPGDPGATVVTNSCAFYPLRTRLRVHRAPGIPHALFGRKILPQPGRIAPRECFSTSLRGAARRSNPAFYCVARNLDCFASLAMTVKALSRDDGPGANPPPESTPRRPATACRDARAG